MSPRAAWRLESLGFTAVYDYAAGKADWLAWGLPREGTAQVPTVGEVARRGVPTCVLADRVADAKARAQTSGFDACAVVNERRVVLGLLRSQELEMADPAMTAEQVMRAGPTTYRPNVAARDAAARMRARGVDTLLVTTPDGALVGLLLREDAERAGGAERAEHAGADDGQR